MNNLSFEHTGFAKSESKIDLAKPESIISSGNTPGGCGQSGTEDNSDLPWPAASDTDTGSYYYIDTHAHLDMLKQMTPDFAVSESARQQVKYIINISSDLQGSIKSTEYAFRFKNVFAAVGVHPHDAQDFNESTAKELESLIMQNKKIVAIGETGFDYFRNLSPKDAQKKAFTSQIELALKYRLPLVVHDRDAHEDTLGVLKHYSDYGNNKDFRVVIHCFSGDSRFALECLKLGFFISFTGVITFPNAKELVNTVREVPLDRIFLETDAPFLAPQEKRGRENYPGFVKYIADKIAGIKQVPLEIVARTTSKNAEDFFNLFTTNNCQ
jgi:TatD DNase family protein